MKNLGNRPNDRGRLKDVELGYLFLHNIRVGGLDNSNFQETKDKFAQWELN